MRLALLLVLLLFWYSSDSHAQPSNLHPHIHGAMTWEYVGPDSLNWKSIKQMDLLFDHGGAPRIALVTTRGITVNSTRGWRYMFLNTTESFPPLYYDQQSARTFNFSRWDDSIAFVALDVSNFEAGTVGYVVHRLLSDQWAWASNFMNCWVGFSPQAAFVFPRSNTGVAYAWLCGFEKTTNNGSSWQQPTYWMGSQGYFLSINERVDSILYAGVKPTSGDVGVYKSSDEGSSWHIIFPFPTSYQAASFLALGDTLLLGTRRAAWDSLSARGIFRSTDQGLTWSLVLNGIDIDALTLGKDGRIFLATENDIYSSLDAGGTWGPLTQFPFPTKVTGFIGDRRADTLYVATNNSGVYKVYGFTTSVEQTVSAVLDYSLGQNYPNPYNSSTVITYRLAQRAHTLLRIYDLLGRTIKILEDQFQDSGTHTVSFDSGSLPSGVYFYQIRSNAFSDMRKMIICK